MKINWVLLIALLFASPSLLAAPPPKPPVPAKDVLTMATDSPQLSKLKIQVAKEVPEATAEPLNGKVVLDEDHTARIYSPVLGRALRISAQIGDNVKAGQVLMQLDSPDLGSAVADTRKAEAELNFKQHAAERAKLLYEHGVIAQKELESAQADLAKTEAEATRARGRLSNLGGSKAGERIVTTGAILLNAELAEGR